MQKFKSVKNYYPLLFAILLVIICITTFILSEYIEMYILTVIFKIGILVFTLHQTYYILSAITISYCMDDDYIYIKSFLNLRNVKIKIKDIEGYVVKNDMGVKLSGFSFAGMAIGRNYLEDIGITRMFVTSNKNIIYILCKDISYCITPVDVEGFILTLKKDDIRVKVSRDKTIKENNLNRDKKFVIPLILSFLSIALIIFIPFLLYINGKLPETMPLNFNVGFTPMEIGISKQFAFQQMLYGSMNLVVLFCMYLAANCNQKYDLKSSYKYMFISLFMSVTTLIVQFRILYIYL